MCKAFLGMEDIVVDKTDQNFSFIKLTTTETDAKLNMKFDK